MPNQKRIENSTAAKRTTLCSGLLIFKRTALFAVLLGIVLSSVPQPIWAQASSVQPSAPTAGNSSTPFSYEKTTTDAETSSQNYKSPEIFVSQPDPLEIQDLILKGNALETPTENRPIDWNEALNFWESALRDYPAETILLKRYYRARIQYDVNYRLADKRYVELVNNMPLEQGKQTLTDILYKIEFSYVDNANWAVISHNGLVGISQALRNPTFRSQYLSRFNSSEIARMEQTWIQNARVIKVDNAYDAFTQAISAASMIKRDCQINEAVIIMEYLCGILNVLDQYTCLLTPTQFLDMTNQINGEFVGIGVELKTVKGELKVVRPITGSPAQKAGIRPGDSIVAVNGQRTADSTPEKISNRLQGESGSTVYLEIARRNSPNQTVAIVRQPVKSPCVENVKIIDEVNRVGYLKINHFQKTTASELDAALLYLNSLNMKSLIIDLRGNPGGLLAAAVDASNRFISKGTIVSTKGKNPQENHNFYATREMTSPIPLVVLIDKNSASASEIFAGAMRDHRRAAIVGTQSYGKGSVQGIFPLQNSSMGLRMTTAKFYSPLGKPFVRVGVSPDIEVRKASLLSEDVDPYEVIPEQDDAILQAGINAARQRSMSFE
ncbi:MAG: S41 family peptidase [Thermoguttaceae bacterium]|nr:S41 family peptidase [Thermoguttaceae bacterium]MBQ6616371.1 S41 family peptidase [Thermoguttaceae bacterium]